MSGMPADIIAAAESAWQPTSFECKLEIAGAILAERRRCAEVARTFEDWGDCGGLLETASMQIAHKIEAGG